MRLCANTGTQLHLIHPLGFELDDKRLRRAGLDYTDWQNVKEYDCYADFIRSNLIKRIFAFSTRGKRFYSDVQYQSGDAFLFGPETRGLPQSILNALPTEQVVRIPMRENSRSLNLSNSVAVVVYAAWAQHGFQSGK